MSINFAKNLILFQSFGLATFVKTMAKRRIVIDFDVGTDDAIALMMFLHADQIGSIKIEALICSYGNTEREHVVENTVRLLELANRTNVRQTKRIDQDFKSSFGKLG